MFQKFWLMAAAVLAGAVLLRGEPIDNSALLPPILDDRQVKLEQPRPDATASPDWVKSLIIVEANVQTASTDGTFRGMEKTLDHLALMGVNGIWITPINDGNHYGIDLRQRTS